jgi:DNA-binding LacI/PurR family transcriptional regulator
VKNSRMVDEVDWRPFSMVRCNNSTAHLEVNRVESDVFDAAWKATKETLERGYHKLGLSLFRHARGFEDDVRRVGAFRLALEETEGKHSKAGAVFSHNGKWDQAKFMRWFEKHPMDALVCFGVVEYYWLIEAGVRIPEDLGIVALTSAGGDTPITGCREDFERIVLTAFRACEQSIRARENGFVERPQAINIPCLWHEGKTLPRR